MFRREKLRQAFLDRVERDAFGEKAEELPRMLSGLRTSLLRKDP